MYTLYTMSALCMFDSVLNLCCLKEEAAPIPQGTCYSDLTESGSISAHHLVTKEKLRQLIPESWHFLGDAEKEIYKQEIADYINRDHIKGIIIRKYILNRPQEEHGKAIYASILFNPNNLVKGPAGSIACYWFWF